MSIIQAIILGLIQGLTEFLPISSSGHIVIFEKILNVHTTNGVLFEIMLHVGTLLAIMIVYWQDILDMFMESFGLTRDIATNIFRKTVSKLTRKQYDGIYLIKTRGRKMIVLVLIACIPTAIMGIAIKGFIEDFFLKSLFAVGVALMITGLLLRMSKRKVYGDKDVATADYQDAFMVGIMQGIAIVPGISRSGSTIVGGLFSKFKKEFAVKFSFLISIPAILGAAILKISEVKFEEIYSEFGIYASGMIASAVIGYISIRMLNILLKENKFQYFSYYCFFIGMVAILWDTLLLH